MSLTAAQRAGLPSEHGDEPTKITSLFKKAKEVLSTGSVKNFNAFDYMIFFIVFISFFRAQDIIYIIGSHLIVGGLIYMSQLERERRQKLRLAELRAKTKKK